MKVYSSSIIILKVLTYSCSRCYIYVLFQCHGDIELNPGSKKFKNKSLSVWHCNLDSLTAHNYSKFTQVKAYNALYNYDFICLSETYLDSTTLDNLLKIDGFNLVRADHPNNINRGRVCIYYKESLPVRVISLPYLKEAFILEMKDNNEKMIVSAIYRYPSQNNCESDFLLNFEQLLSNISTCKPSVFIITGDLIQDLLPVGLMTSTPWKDQNYIRSHPQTDFLN